jgi:hypothetical protein
MTITITVDPADANIILTFTGAQDARSAAERAFHQYAEELRAKFAPPPAPPFPGENQGPVFGT